MSRTVLAALLLAAMGPVTACVSTAQAEEPPQSRLLETLTGQYDVSEAAMATAVRTHQDAPIGIIAYDVPREAIEAGDMAAFIALVKMAHDDGEAPDGIGPFVLAVDRVADGDFAAARTYLDGGRGSPLGDLYADFAEAWLLALEDDMSAAIRAQRRVSDRLPGLTGDLGLAAMLEAAGREDEALAVYSAMTPARIEAPEHEFDPQGIVFTHIQMVISRQTLLLFRLGRIEEAKTVYRRLAEAEPERAVAYEAALESLETGRGIDVDTPTMNGAFARSISDLSLAFYQQRLIRNAMAGRRTQGLDERRATLDQLALLVDPADENLRDAVISGLSAEALYDGAAHTAMTAPEPTAGLQISAAHSFLMADNRSEAMAAIERAVDLADEDERLGIYSGAIGLHALMANEDEALDLSDQAIALVTNPAEEAGFNALKASILEQFGRYREAVDHASRARDLDDTHDRRMALANVMGKAGMIDDAIRLLQIERLKRPDDPYMLNSYGYFLLEHTEDYSEAYKVLFVANELATNNPYIADSLGWAYFKLGHLDQAKRLIEVARDALAPRKHWEIEDHLGDILWHLDDTEGARVAWQTALDEFPPESARESITAKLADGLEGPAPEKQTLPRVDRDVSGMEGRET